METHPAWRVQTLRTFSGSLLQEVRALLCTRFDFLPQFARLCFVTSPLTGTCKMNLQEKRAEEGYFRTSFCTPKPSEEQEMKSPRRFVEVGMYCRSAGIMMEDAKDGCEKYTMERKVFSRHTFELKLGFSPALCLSAPFTPPDCLAHMCISEAEAKLRS